MGNRNEELHVVRCDIGTFVVAVERLKVLIKPLYSVYETFYSVTRWEKPLISLFSFCVATLIAATNPEYLGNMLILPVPFFLSLGLLRKLGERRQATSASIYSFFKRRDEHADLLAKKAAIQRAQEHLIIYLDILIGIQSLCNDVSDKLEAFYDIFNWKKPKLSMFVLIGSALVIVLVSALQTEHLAIIIVLCTFLINTGFKRTVKTCSSKFCTALYFLSGHRSVSADKDDEENSAEDDYGVGIVNGDFRTAEISETSDSSDDEVEAHWNKETGVENIPQPRAYKARSVVSRLANYGRQKIKKWSSGNCMSCKVSFSTILKKRQYCRHCGYSFCSKCCHQRVPRAVFGATAPAAYEQTVLVCTSCYEFLINRMKNKNTEIVE